MGEWKKMMKELKKKKTIGFFKNNLWFRKK